jgi:hypothetical protein
MGSYRKSIEWIRHVIGLDRAVLFTLLSRLLQIISSTGTVLLIIRFLSPVAQGYYYTILSLAALQVIFELGFSFVILQLAAHESAHLAIHADGTIEGDPVAHARLASVLQLSLRWYLRAAVGLAAILLPVGIAFFARKAGGVDQIAWLGPWIAVVLAVSLAFLITPLFSFFEGCNQVRQVAAMRMYQALVTLGMSWASIASGYGLYAPALVNLGIIVLGANFIRTRRRILSSLLRLDPGEHGVSWSTEVWPFQWKIAVSWLCSYFAAQVFTPILFASRGPQEAGKMGLSLSITAYLPIVALSWITTKAAPFGRLVRQRRLQELDHLFFRTLRQSFFLVLTLCGACFAAVVVAQRLLPSIAARMEVPSIFALLLLTAIASFVIQCLAVYLRSFKREPYLNLSITVATLTVASVALTASKWGNKAVALCYFLFSGIIGLSWALGIFIRARRTGCQVDLNLPDNLGSIPAVEAASGLTFGESDLERGSK